MAARYLSRALLSTTKPLSSAAVIPKASFIIFRLRPIIAAVSASYVRDIAPSMPARGLAWQSSSSSLNDPYPNLSSRPPKDTIVLDGCDFEHWLVVMEKPAEADMTRDEIIDSYIKALAKVVGSEEEARMKIYSVSTRHYYAFGALMSEEHSYKIREVPRVTWVLPDSYMDAENKDYGGEPFINGQAVPYDPKYHEEWVRNDARFNKRRNRKSGGSGDFGGGPPGGMQQQSYANDGPENDQQGLINQKSYVQGENGGQGQNQSGGYVNLNVDGRDPS